MEGEGSSTFAVGRWVRVDRVYHRIVHDAVLVDDRERRHRYLFACRIVALGDARAHVSIPTMGAAVCDICIGPAGREAPFG